MKLRFWIPILLVALFAIGCASTQQAGEELRAPIATSAENTATTVPAPASPHSQTVSAEPSPIVAIPDALLKRRGEIKMSSAYIDDVEANGVRFYIHPDVDEKTGKFYVRPTYAPIFSKDGTPKVIVDGTEVKIWLEGALPDEVKSKIATHLRVIMPDVATPLILPWPITPFLADPVLVRVKSPIRFSHLTARSAGDFQREHLFIFNARSEDEAKKFGHEYRNDGNIVLRVSAILDGWDTTSRAIQVKTSTIREVLADAAIEPTEGVSLDLSRSGREHLQRKFETKIRAEITQRGKHVPIDPDLYNRLARTFEKQWEDIRTVDLEKDDYAIPLWSAEDLKATLTKRTLKKIEERVNDLFQTSMSDCRNELIRNREAKKEDIEKIFYRNFNTGSSTEVDASVGVLCFSADASVKTSSFLSETTFDKMKKHAGHETDFHRETDSSTKNDLLRHMQKSRKEEFEWEGEQWTPKRVRVSRLKQEAFVGNAILDVIETDLLAVMQEKSSDVEVKFPGDPGMTLTQSVDQRFEAVGKPWVEQYVKDQQFATQTWVNQQGFATPSLVEQRVNTIERWADDHINKLYRQIDELRGNVKSDWDKGVARREQIKATLVHIREFIGNAGNHAERDQLKDFFILYCPVNRTPPPGHSSQYKVLEELINKID